MHQTHEISMVNRKVKTQKHSSKTLIGHVQIYNIHGTGVLRAEVYHGSEHHLLTEIVVAAASWMGLTHIKV